MSTLYCWRVIIIQIAPESSWTRSSAGLAESVSFTWSSAKYWDLPSLIEYIMYMLASLLASSVIRCCLPMNVFLGLCCVVSGVDGDTDELERHTFGRCPIFLHFGHARLGHFNFLRLPTQYLQLCLLGPTSVWFRIMCRFKRCWFHFLRLYSAGSLLLQITIDNCLV